MSLDLTSSSGSGGAAAPGAQSSSGTSSGPGQSWENLTRAIQASIEDDALLQPIEDRPPLPAPASTPDDVSLAVRGSRDLALPETGSPISPSSHWPRAKATPVVEEPPDDSEALIVIDEQAL